MNCPRRDEMLNPDFAKIAGDHDDWRPDGTCSFCGSCSPDLFFQQVRAGVEIGPTDKNYKAYVDLPEDKPDELTVSSAISWTPTEAEIAQQGLRSSDDPEVRAVMERDRWGTKNHDGSPRWVVLRKKGSTRFGKFYFQHLNDEERQLFIALYNDKTMKVGNPGYFYSKPFFVKQRESQP